jgi:hypothetical protein
MIKHIPTLIAFLFLLSRAEAQEILKLEDIFQQIQKENPALKVYDANIRSLDEAAKGTRNWDAPQLSTGLWMAPYNPGLWKEQGNGATGMGQYMISAEQMFPNKKRQDAEEKYMQGLSSV